MQVKPLATLVQSSAPVAVAVGVPHARSACPSKPGRIARNKKPLISSSSVTGHHLHEQSQAFAFRETQRSLLQNRRLAGTQSGLTLLWQTPQQVNRRHC